MEKAAAKPIDKAQTVVSLFYNPAFKDRKVIGALNASQKKIQIVIHPKDQAEKDIHADLYEAVCDTVHRVLLQKNTAFCQGLNEEFIDESLEKADAIVLVESVSNRNKTLYGFATIQFNVHALFVDLICTNNAFSGTGTFMMDILNQAATLLKKEQIELNSTTAAVGFYLKKNFKCHDTCPMVLKLSPDNNSKTVAKTQYKKSKSKSKSRSKTVKQSMHKEATKEPTSMV